MGRFAQYRKRGNGSTPATEYPAPTSDVWELETDEENGLVTLGSVAPGGAICGAKIMSYAHATPQIFETSGFVGLGDQNHTGAAYAPGTLIGVRVAWLDCSSGLIVSPWSAEKTTTTV